MATRDIFLSLAFWTGLASVICFAWSRFKVTLTDIDELVPPLQPRAFTTSFRFYLATGVYVCGFSMVYLVLLGLASVPAAQGYLKQLLASVGAANSGAEEFGTPTWAALMATAVLPALPGIASLDKFARDFLQDFASIPGKARALAREALSLLKSPEPPASTDTDSLESIHAALHAHKARFDQLEKAWLALDEQLTENFVGRRHRKFRETSRKIMEGLAQEFASNPQDWETVQSAHYAERRQRTEVRKAARFIMCGILDAEKTEFRVRARLNKLGIPVPVIGIDFGPPQIFVAALIIYVVAVAGCFLSVLVHHLFFGTAGGLSDYMATKSGGFAAWAALWVVTYVLPILLAAGISMSIIDRMNDRSALRQPSDRTFELTVTFAGAALVAFFPILIARVVQGIPLSWLLLLVEVLPWVLGPASLAAVFVWLSTPSQDVSSRLATKTAYVLLHGTAALVGSTVALLLWTGLRRGPPDTLAFFLMPIVGALVGAAIGLVLSGTRIQPAAPAAQTPGAG